MSVLSRVRQSPGLVSPVSPYIEYIKTDNTLSEISVSGFLNDSVEEFGYYTNNTLALVYITDGAPVFANIEISGSNISFNVNAGDGNVVGPGSSTLNAIAVYGGITGEVLLNSLAILTPDGSLSGLNLVSGNSFTSDLFVTRASGRVSFLNPAGTFTTSWRAGANTANLTYIWPTALPTADGQAFTANMDGSTRWATPSAGGDVFGPASSIVGEIVVYSDTTGKKIAADGPRIIGGDMIDIQSITANNDISAQNYNTKASGNIALKNPANTFYTILQSGPVTSTQGYFLPDSLPVSKNRPWVATTTGATGQLKNLDCILLELKTAPASITMVSNTAYLSTNNSSRNRFTIPLTAFSEGDIFRIKGYGSGGWEILVNSSQEVLINGLVVADTQLIQSTYFTDTAYIECLSTGSPKQFNLIIESGMLLLTTPNVVVGANDVVGGTSGYAWISNGPNLKPTFQPIPSGSMPVVEVTGSTTMTVNTVYVANSASPVVLTVPASVPFGSVFKVIGKGVGGWVIQANTGQTIYHGIATSSVAGSSTCTARRDNATIECITANTELQITEYSGFNLITV